MRRSLSVAAIVGALCSASLVAAQSRSPSTNTPEAIASGVVACLAADDGDKFNQKKLAKPGWRIDNLVGIPMATRDGVHLLLGSNNVASSCTIMEEWPPQTWAAIRAAISARIDSEPEAIDDGFNWKSGERLVRFAGEHPVFGSHPTIVIVRPRRTK